MMSGEWEPTPVQREIIGHSEGSLCVSAAAGTGKTGVLVERYLRLITTGAPDGRVSPGRILAVTFTEKAAQNIKEKIWARLTERGEEDLKREMELAYVGTIHSFCTRLLRENAFEVALDPGFRVLDQAQQSVLLRGIVEEHFLSGGEELLELVQRYGEREFTSAMVTLVSLFRSMGKSYDQIEEEGRLFSSLLDGLRAEVDGVIGPIASVVKERAEELISYSLPGKGEEKRLRFVELAGELEASRRSAPILLDLRENLKNLKRSKGTDPRPYEIMDEVRLLLKKNKNFLNYDDDLEELLLRDRQGMVLNALEVLRRYDRAKDAIGALDYDDLQRRAIDLLETNKDLSRHYRERFRWIMVDEFQDTNQLQNRIINLLRREDNLFVVGDIKQSIYGFRDAQVEIFRDYLEGAQGGPRMKSISLQDNFRSSRQLISFFNSFFRRLWGEDGFPFEPLIYCRKEEERTEGPAVEVFLVRGREGDNAERQRIMEAEAVAARLMALVGRPSAQGADERGRRWSFGDAAVLFRKGTGMRIYERVFHRWGIPFRVASSRGFFESREVADIISFITVVENPYDDIPLAAVLRSPMVGVSDDTLFLLRRDLEGGGIRSPFLYDALVRSDEIPHIEGEERERLRAFVSLLTRLRALRGRLSPGELVSRMIRETGYNLSILTLHDAARRVGNVEKFIQMADDYHRSSPCDLSGFLRFVKRLREIGIREGEAEPEGTDTDAVTIATIHAAKGLEFPIVVMADMGSKLETGPSRSAMIVERERLWTAKYYSREGERVETVSGALALRREKEREFAEEKRVLYVGMTRAMDHLILAGGWKGDGLKGVNDAGSQMDWVRTILRLEEPLLSAHLPGQRSGDSILDFDGSEVTVKVVDGEVERGERVRHRSLRDLAGDGFLRDGALPHKEGLRVDEGVRGEAELILSRALFSPEGKGPGVRRRLSVTALDAYRLCPLKFHLNYLLKMPQAHGLAVGAEEKGQAAGGVRFGEAFHRAMELIEPEMDLEGQLHELASAGIIDSAMVVPLKERLGGLFDGPLGEMIRRGDGIEKERSFTLALGDSMIAGTIDLLIHGGAGGTRIVDYKTDSVGPEEVDERAEEYSFQLRAYAYALREISGTSPAAGLFYFATPGVLKGVDVSEEALNRWETEALLMLEEIERRKFAGREGTHCYRCGYLSKQCCVKTD